MPFNISELILEEVESRLKGIEKWFTGDPQIIPVNIRETIHDLPVAEYYVFQLNIASYAVA